MRNAFLKSLFLAGLLITLPSVLAQRQPQRTNPEPPTEEMGWLTPADDWVAAVRAGGVVRLGPGEFMTAELVEITTDLNLQGSGASETIVTFDSDGGELFEQVAIHSPTGLPVLVVMSDITFLHGATHRSDLVTLLGPVHLEVRSSGVGLAFDDVSAILESDSSVFYGTGILVMDGASLSVSDSYLFGNVQAIAAFDAGQIQVHQSSFLENVLTGIYVEEAPLSVSNSLFTANYVGMEVYGRQARNFSNNQFVEQLYLDVIDEE